MFRVVSVVALFIAGSLIADERPVASNDLVEELKSYCMEVEPDYRAPSQTFDEFLLQCINDELDSEGFRPLLALN